MKHERYNGGIIRPRGDKWVAEINRGDNRARKVFDAESECRSWIDREQLTATREITAPTSRELLDMDDARRMLPANVSLRDAAACWLEHHKQSVLGAMKLDELYRRYLVEKTAAGLRPRSIADIKANLGRLVRAFGALPIAQISALNLHDTINKHKYSPVTRNNLRRYWFGFFEFCRKLGAIQVNPAESITPGAHTDEKMPAIFTPDQAAAILKEAAKEFPGAPGNKHTVIHPYPDLVPFVAITMFAGLRTAEALGLDWSAIGPAEIKVVPEIAKKRRQRIIPMPENLRKILAPRRKLSGPVVPVRHRRLYVHLRRFAKAAGLKSWPPNASRHSFASYSMALNKSAAQTAASLGHSGNTAVLFNHYRELVTEKDARRYFSISTGFSIR